MDASDAPILLELTNVAASYGPRMVFRDVSFALRQGEVLVVSGANGSGKSTLLRLICGLQQPEVGEIWFMAGAERREPRDAMHLLGWVAPDLMLYRELSGLENLRFFAAVRGLRRSDMELEAMLARVGLGGRGDDRVAAYSSGMQHRLRYAYALLHQPPLLILDEPTVTLDERGAEVVQRIVERQRRVGAVVIATNDPRELRFGDYVLTLNAAN